MPPTWPALPQYDDVQVLVAAQAASRFTPAIRTHRTAPDALPTRTPSLQKRSLEITERAFQAVATNRSSTCSRRSTQYLEHARIDPRSLKAASVRCKTRSTCCLPDSPGPVPEMAAGRGNGFRPTGSCGHCRPAERDLLRRRADVRTAEMRLAAQSAQIGISVGGSLSIDHAGWIGRSLGGTSLDWFGADPRNGAWVPQPGVEHIRLGSTEATRCWSRTPVSSSSTSSIRGPCCAAARELDDAADRIRRHGPRPGALSSREAASRRPGGRYDIATIQYREGTGRTFERVLDSQRSAFQPAGAPGQHAWATSRKASSRFTKPWAAAGSKRPCAAASSMSATRVTALPRT